MNLTPAIKAASRASMSAQSRFLWAVRIQLGCLITAALAGALIAAVDATWPGLVSAVAFVGAFAATTFISATRPERAWYDGRAAAESLKTLAWRYTVGGSPFGLDAAGQRETDESFVRAISEVIQALPFARASEDAGAQITEEMRAARAKSLSDRRVVYEEGRIIEQQRWYGSRAEFNELRGRRWAIGLIVVEVIGIVLGFAEVGGVLHLDLIGVAAAVAGAVTAWLQTKQHESLARAYAVAAQELAAIRSLITHQETEADWASFVDESEEAISREHTLWRASRGVLVPRGIQKLRRGSPG